MYDGSLIYGIQILVGLKKDNGDETSTSCYFDYGTQIGDTCIFTKPVNYGGTYYNNHKCFVRIYTDSAYALGGPASVLKVKRIWVQ
jgi:hypothetical protein